MDQAEKELVDSIWDYRDYLLGNALSWTQTYEEAEDVVSETMLRAIEKIHQFKPGTNFRAWLTCICYSRAMNMYSKKKRNPQNMPGAKEGWEVQAEPEGEHPDRETILHAIMRLPEVFRDTTLLRYYQHYKYSEIAEAQDIAIGTVMSRLYRAKLILMEDEELKALIAERNNEVPYDAL